MNIKIMGRNDNDTVIEIECNTDRIINQIVESNGDGTFKLSIKFSSYYDQGKIVEQPFWLVFSHCHKDDESEFGYACYSNDYLKSGNKEIFYISIPECE